MADSVGRTAGHVETHFSGGNLVRDVVLGLSDGLTVPFALAPGVRGDREHPSGCRGRAR